jgi:hypothetical protein
MKGHQHKGGDYPGSGFIESERASTSVLLALFCCFSGGSRPCLAAFLDRSPKKLDDFHLA